MTGASGSAPLTVICTWPLPTDVNERLGVEAASTSNECAQKTDIARTIDRKIGLVFILIDDDYGLTGVKET